MDTVYEKLLKLNSLYNFDKKGNSIIVSNTDKNISINSFYDDITKILDLDLSNLTYQVKSIPFISEYPVINVFNNNINIGIIIMHFFNQFIVFN
jgi:hypothetical protein